MSDPGAWTVRKRSTPFHFGSGKSWDTRYYMHLAPRTSAVTTSGLGTSVFGTQVTGSRGNPWPPGKGQHGDIGSDFFTEKRYVIGSSDPVNFGRPRFRYFTEMSFDGRFVIDWADREAFSVTPVYPVSPTVQGNNFPSSLRSGNSSLDALGATAVANCKPTNMDSNLATMFGELAREGIPAYVGAQTWKSRTKTAKAAGGDYLNIQFGWAPLIRDIASTANALARLNQIWDQLERDAGRTVRRSFHFPLQQESFETVTAVNQMPHGVFHSDITEGCTLGDVIRTVKTERKVWFKGAFTYHLPSGSDSRNGLVRNVSKLNAMLGLNLTPEVVWNLAPWSWALDWFANVGDVLSNVSDVQLYGLVMRYGYIMEHTVSSVTYSMPKFRLKYSPGFRVSSLSYVTETKVRRKANPFGFGVDWNGLSPYQLSILAALGLSRT
jgi:hypothetical protein